MRQKVAKRIRKAVGGSNAYRQAKREYVRKRGRQFPKLELTKRQNRIARHDDR